MTTVSTSVYDRLRRRAAELCEERDLVPIVDAEAGRRRGRRWSSRPRSVRRKGPTHVPGRGSTGMRRRRATKRRAGVADAFSIRTCILREYAEELFGYKDLEQGRGDLEIDVSALPPVRQLLDAIQAGVAVIGCTGFAIPLTTLRPEVCQRCLSKSQDGSSDRLRSPTLATIGLN